MDAIVGAVDGAPTGPLNANWSASQEDPPGVILWSWFWENVSKLLKGLPLEQVLRGDSVQQSAVSSGSISMKSRYFDWKRYSRFRTLCLIDLCFFFLTSDAVPRYRSDSDLARQLQAECDAEAANARNAAVHPAPSGSTQAWNSTSNFWGDAVSTAVATAGSDSRPRSDSDIARELQAQWNREDGVPELVPTVQPSFENPHSIRGSSTAMQIQSPQPPPQQSMLVAATPPRGRHRHDRCVASISQNLIDSLHDIKLLSIADESAESYTMYHFNGLEGQDNRNPRLTKFRIYLRYSAYHGLIILSYSSISEFMNNDYFSTKERF